MLAVVRKPHIEIKGDLPEDFIEALKERFPDIQLINENFIDIKDTDFWRKTKVTPGNTLKIYRENFGYTQEELAQKIGLKRQNISNYENGHKTIGGKIAIKLSEIFNLPVERFLTTF